jgi:hypothetical protein
MTFSLVWDKEAAAIFNALRVKAKKSVENRQTTGKTKAAKDEGLFKQVKKCINLLKTNPRHPGLQSHQFSAVLNPYYPKQKVFEAYVQQNTHAAYRVFWCYGPGKDQITILAIIKHPA